MLRATILALEYCNQADKNQEKHKIMNNDGVLAKAVTVTQIAPLPADHATVTTVPVSIINPSLVKYFSYEK